MEGGEEGSAALRSAEEVSLDAMEVGERSPPRGPECERQEPETEGRPLVRPEEEGSFRSTEGMPEATVEGESWRGEDNGSGRIDDDHEEPEGQQLIQPEEAPSTEERPEEQTDEGAAPSSEAGDA